MMQQADRYLHHTSYRTSDATKCVNEQNKYELDVVVIEAVVVVAVDGTVGTAVVEGPLALAVDGTVGAAVTAY